MWRMSCKCDDVYPSYGRLPTLFRVTLIPAKYDIRYYRVPYDSHTLSGRLVNWKEFSPVMEKVRLLIIDEHEAVRNALATRLSSSPAIAVVATAHALSQENSAQMDAADVALYGLKSSSDADLDTTIAVVEELTCRRTAVIILTSYADDIERELLLKSGAYRYLLKNINSNQLITEILEVAAEVRRPTS